MKNINEKELRIGIIGTCHRADMVDKYLTPEDNVKIVSGADITEHQLNIFKNRILNGQGNAPNCYFDYREMIEKENLDGVFITSPDFCHEEQAIFALSHNVSVYLEKPMAISIEGCDRILAEARKSSAKLFIGHNLRYAPFVLKMKELIESGAIGDVKAIWCRHFVGIGGDAFFLDWHADRRYSKGLLVQKASHDIDVIHWLANSYAKRVHGFGALALYDKLPRREKEPTLPIKAAIPKGIWPPEKMKDLNPVIDVEDVSNINMQLQNGVQASYMQCNFTPDTWRNYTVIGSKGRIENHGDLAEGATIELYNQRHAFRREGDSTFRLQKCEGGHGGADPKIIRNFFDILRGNAAPSSSPQASRYSVAVGCLGTDSIRSGGVPLDMPELPPELENYEYHK